MAKESIKDLTKEELKLKLRDYQDELMNLRFQKARGELANTSRIRFVKRKIAQIKTILHEYKLGIRKEGKEEK